SGGLTATTRKCLTATEPAAATATEPPLAQPPAAEPPVDQPPAEQPSAQEPPAATPLAPEKRLSIKKTGPEQKRVGETALFTIEVTNESSVAIENLEIADNFETSLQPIRATEGSTMLKGNSLGWKVDRLEPGRSLRRAV